MLVAACFGAAISGGGPASAGEAAAPDALATAIQSTLEADTPVFKSVTLDIDSLRRFYAQRHFRPVWSGDAAAKARATLARDTLATASDDGLNPAAYRLSPPPASELAGKQPGLAEELLLTNAVLHYAHDLRLGRLNAGEVEDDIALPPQLFDAVAALSAALAADRLAPFFAALPPPDPAYARLKDALRRYRAYAAAGGWPQLPNDWAPLRPTKDKPGREEIKVDGDDARLPLLRQRLAVEDDTLAPTPDKEVKGDLVAALKRFQTKHGIDPDGRIGAKTLYALNMTAAERVRQITANLERWRWLARQLEPRRVMVNTADGSLVVLDNGKTMITSNVIVGDEKHSSPMLRAVANVVTVNPPWKIPLSIARKEILPKLRRDPTYLVNEEIVILNGPEDDPYGVKIDWSKVSAGRFPYLLEQLPGPKNPLGGVKLEMVNRFDVYLHDTPSRKLFARVQRTFSHGCIRVEAALALASFAMTGDTEKGLDQIKAEIEAGATRHHPVRPPLPVYLLYWTAFEDADGTVQFRPDSYGRDLRLMAALAAHAGTAAQAKLHPAPHGHKGNG